MRSLIAHVWVPPMPGPLTRWRGDNDLESRPRSRWSGHAITVHLSVASARLMGDRSNPRRRLTGTLSYSWDPAC